MGKLQRTASLLLLSLGLIVILVGPLADADDAPGPAAAPVVDAGENPAGGKRPDEDYYELFSVLVDTLDQVERNYVKKISRRELIEAAIEGVLHKLDPYSNYIPPTDITKFRTSVENQFGGIGIQIMPDEDKLKILTPLVGSPAYRGGLEAGDTITEIEGKSAKGLSVDDAVKQLKGEVGTKVTMTVVHSDRPEPQTVTLEREIVHLETVLGERRQANDQWDFMLDPEQKIGYIRLTAFGRETANELKRALTELQASGIRGLVLDLRFNPGGLLTSAVEVSDLFVKEGRIVSTEGRNTDPRSWDAQVDGTFDGFPMVVLVNHFSASSSEIVAACLQDHKRAIIVGERTWGKGSVQNVVELEGGRSALKLTTASYLRPSGKNIHRFPDAAEGDEWGVMPDEGYAVRLSNDEVRRIVASRRERDVVHPHHEDKTPEQIAINAPTAEPVKSDSEPAAAEPGKTEEKTPTTEQPPAEEKNTDQPATDKTKPEEPAVAEPAAPDPHEPTKNADGDQADEQPADEKQAPDEKADQKSAAGDSTKINEPDGEAIDRQLQKALEYLRGELSKSAAQ